MSLLVPAHPSCPRQRAICMYVICLCLCLCIFMLLCLVVLLQHNKQTVIIILDSNGNVHCMMNAIMPTKTLRRFIRLYLNTHTTSLRPFLHDYPGEPVPEEIFFWTLWCNRRYQRQTHQQCGSASLHPD